MIFQPGYIAELIAFLMVVFAMREGRMRRLPLFRAVAAYMIFIFLLEATTLLFRAYTINYNPNLFYNYGAFISSLLLGIIMMRMEVHPRQVYIARALTIASMVGIVLCLLFGNNENGVNASVIQCKYFFVFVQALTALFYYTKDESGKPLTREPGFYFTAGMLQISIIMILHFLFFWIMVRNASAEWVFGILKNVANVIFYLFMAACVLRMLRPSALVQEIRPEKG